MKKQERNAMPLVLGVIVLLLTLVCFAMLIAGNDAAVTVLGLCMFGGMLLLGASESLAKLFARRSGRDVRGAMAAVAHAEEETDEEEDVCAA